MFAPYTLDQLTIFLAVVDEGSLSAAGRRVGRVQSAVSYAVAQLESALGSRLFARDGRGATLTDAGHLLAGEARLVLARARELSEAAERLQAGIEPELRVVVDALYPLERLGLTCRAFSERFPTTSLRLRVGLLADAADEVTSGQADLGACNLAGAVPTELAVGYLGDVQLLPVCASDHALASTPGPQRASDLEPHVQIVHSERSGAHTTDQGVLASRTWRVSDLALKEQLILVGVGWGSLPAPLALRHLAAGRVVRLFPAPWPSDGHHVGLHAVVRRDRPLGRAGQWFRDQLAL